MEAVNEGIKSMNIENKVNYLKLHMEGIRLERGKAMHKHYPAKPIWRELQVRRRLHLTPKYNEKVCRKAAHWAAFLQTFSVPNCSLGVSRI